MKPAWILLFAAIAACGDDAVVPADGTTGGGGTSSSTGVAPSSSGAPPTDTTASTSTGVSSSESTTGEDVPPEPLLWVTDCVVGGSDLSLLHPDLECGGATVPLDWDDPEGQSIEIAVFRVRTQQPRQGQVWLLDGGPGGSGLALLLDGGVIDDYRDAGWDVVVPSHRGTVSPMLDCPTGVGSGKTCRGELESEWGDGLRHFNTVMAAHDVGELIARYQVDADGESTIVYGVSYGSYWAQFFLRDHGDLADGVVLDSVLSSDVDVVSQEDVIQARAEALLQTCVDDPVCGPRVGFASGAEFSAAVVSAIDGGDCGAGDLGLWAASTYRDRFGSLLNRNEVRAFLPLLAALLTRCNDVDSQTASDALNSLLGFFDTVDARFGIDPGLFSSGEVLHVVANTTIIPDGADFSGPLADAQDHLAMGGITALLGESVPVWGDLPNVAWDPEFETDTPLLIFNARYDLQTPLPWAEDAAALYGGVVHVVEDGRHSVASTGSGGDGTSAATPCVRPMILEFAADPSQPPDASCLGDLPTVDVNLEATHLQNHAIDAFGISDPWTLITG